MRDRSFCRDVAQEHFDRTRPSEWFDTLYQEAQGNEGRLPWVDPAPNRNLVWWLEHERPSLAGTRALVVGCGLGQDAEELVRRGATVTAFDISPTAIEWAQRRYADSVVDYRTVDLFAAPPEFAGAFDFVLEAYTIQALPPEVRPGASAAIASFVATGGELLLICRARDEHDDPGTMPWPLTEAEVRSFCKEGLALVNLEDFIDDDGEESVRRFRALFRRDSV